MSMIYTNQRSKKKNKTKKEMAEYQAWLDSVSNQATSFSKKPVKKTFNLQTVPKLTTPVGRETPYYPSKVTPGGSCTKPMPYLFSRMKKQKIKPICGDNRGNIFVQFEYFLIRFFFGCSIWTSCNLWYSFLGLRSFCNTKVLMLYFSNKPKNA
jgi:hypothetical protein